MLNSSTQTEDSKYSGDTRANMVFDWSTALYKTCCHIEPTHNKVYENKNKENHKNNPYDKIWNKSSKNFTNNEKISHKYWK